MSVFSTSNPTSTTISKFTNLSFASLLSWLLPNICVLCSNKTNNNFNLCNACIRDLPLIEQTCWRCGLPMERIDASNTSNNCITTTKITCGICVKQEPPYNKSITLYHYQPPIGYLISGLKFGGKLIHAKLLGHLLAMHLQKYYADYTDCHNSPHSGSGIHSKPQVIIPMPLHPSRLRTRGYNQVVEIARPIAKLLELPIDKRSCTRVKNTQAQSLLKASERKQNIQGAFAIDKKLAKKYQYVAVLDDVITTGNTVKEFCYQLQRIGINEIDIWSCARASLVPR